MLFMKNDNKEVEPEIPNYPLISHVCVIDPKRNGGKSKYKKSKLEYNLISKELDLVNVEQDQSSSDTSSVENQPHRS
jgi:hypothetical protein